MRRRGFIRGLVAGAVGVAFAGRVATEAVLGRGERLAFEKGESAPKKEIVVPNPDWFDAPYEESIVYAAPAGALAMMELSSPMKTVIHERGKELELEDGTVVLAGSLPNRFTLDEHGAFQLVHPYLRKRVDA